MTEDAIFTWRDKGFPEPAAPMPFADVAARGWNVLAEDLVLPLAVLRESALDHNLGWMQAFLRRTGAAIAPHGKTSMAPALLQRLLDAGAWGMTAATAPQVLTFHRHGMRRLLLANQLIGKRNIAAVLGALAADPTLDVSIFVDSHAGLEMLDVAARALLPGRRVPVLVELGFEGGRAGIRDDRAAHALAEAAARAPGLALRGIAAYEGLLHGPQAAAQVDTLMTRVTALAEAAEPLFDDGPVLLTAGGSGYFDLVASGLARARLSRPVEVVLRSGCLFTHDHGDYTRQFADLAARSPEVSSLGAGPRGALEVWAYAQSRPEPGRVIVGLGKRDAGIDVDPPCAIAWARPGGAPQALPRGAWRTVGINDQHLHLAVPEDAAVAVGDLIGFGISHPCTTFDRWRVLALVDDAYRVTGLARTFF